MRITIRGLTVSVGARTLFEDVSIELESPRSVAIMGPSGAGKTSFLGLIAGRVRPDLGTVDLSGRAGGDTVQFDWALQTSPLLSHRSTLDNVMIGPLSRGSTPADAMEAASRALSRVGLGGFESRRPRTMSGGERQRVAVARSLAMDVELLLADEPTASLDPVSRELVVDSLLALRDEGMLVVLATHDNAVAERCDDTYVIQRQKLVLRA